MLNAVKNVQNRQPSVRAITLDVVPKIDRRKFRGVYETTIVKYDWFRLHEHLLIG